MNKPTQERPEAPMNSNNPPALPLPRASFPCCFDSCSDEVSYPADMLFWSNSKKGWVCENCIENLPEGEELETSLADYIKDSSVLAADLLSTRATQKEV